jgi:hypothetical protein
MGECFGMAGDFGSRMALVVCRRHWEFFFFSFFILRLVKERAFVKITSEQGGRDCLWNTRNIKHIGSKNAQKVCG